MHYSFGGSSFEVDYKPSSNDAKHRLACMARVRIKLKSAQIQVGVQAKPEIVQNGLRPNYRTHLPFRLSLNISLVRLGPSPKLSPNVSTFDNPKC